MFMKFVRPAISAAKFQKSPLQDTADVPNPRRGNAIRTLHVALASVCKLFTRNEHLAYEYSDNLEIM